MKLVRNTKKYIPLGVKIILKRILLGILEDSKLFQYYRRKKENHNFKNAFGLNETLLKSYQKKITEWENQPLLSILMPVYNTDPSQLKEALQSVRDQVYKNWELVCVDDASPNSNVQEVLQKFSRMDNRIRVFKLNQNSGISHATQTAYKYALGEYLGFMDHDDKLTKDCLYHVVNALQDRSVDYLYTDEVIFSKSQFTYIAKPAFNLQKLISHNYICHFFVIARSLLEISGGIRSGFDGSQDHELLLRTSRKAKNIVHIPRPLYYWRIGNQMSFSQSKSDDCKHKSKLAISEFLEATENAEFEVCDGRVEFSFHVKRRVPKTDKVSILIPYRNGGKITRNCVESLIHVTTGIDYEILLIDNSSTDLETKQLMDSLEKSYKNVRILTFDHAFNFSSINNYGVSKAKYENILLLNNDTIIFRPDWLYELVQHNLCNDVGAVGAMLLYDDNTIQHAGVVMGIGGVAGHIGNHLPYNSNAWANRLVLEHDVTCVTGACLMTKKSVWKAVGGMDENFPVAFNDVDYCLKLRKQNYRIIYNPYSILYHLESKSRGTDMLPENIFRFRRDMEKLYTKWGKDRILKDEFYNPNLTLLDASMRFKTAKEDEIMEKTVDYHLDPYKPVRMF